MRFRRWRVVIQWVLYRSAKTGRFVSKRYAEAHPETTVKERRHRWVKPDR